MSNPVYMHGRDRTSVKVAVDNKPITEKRIYQRIRQACQPYLPDLLKKMERLSSDDD